MRSHPYTPPSPLPRTVNDLANILPLPKKAYRSLDDSDIPMSLLDPDTSQLLPTRRRRHQVWVQGKLAEVKSVSTANLRSPTAASPGQLAPGTPTFDGVAARPRSADDKEPVDDGACSEEPEVVIQHSQLRGYGIGGAGNIRRPTDVIHGPTRHKISRKNTSPYTDRDLSPGASPDKQRFSLREFLGRRADRKSKAGMAQ